jgi:hypothetical protein
MPFAALMLVAALGHTPVTSFPEASSLGIRTSSMQAGNEALSPGALKLDAWDDGGGGGGGGVDSRTRALLAGLLGFVPGFGIGHFIARDRNGFTTFLIIDIALVVAYSVVGFAFLPSYYLFHGLAGLVWFVVHIFQGLDAYAKAGGHRLIQLQRERTMEVAGVMGTSRLPSDSTRVLALAF